MVVKLFVIIIMTFHFVQCFLNYTKLSGEIPKVGEITQLGRGDLGRDLVHDTTQLSGVLL